MDVCSITGRLAGGASGFGRRDVADAVATLLHRPSTALMVALRTLLAHSCARKQDVVRFELSSVDLRFQFGASSTLRPARSPAPLAQGILKLHEHEPGTTGQAPMSCTGRTHLRIAQRRARNS